MQVTEHSTDGHFWIANLCTLDQGGKIKQNNKKKTLKVIKQTTKSIQIQIHHFHALSFSHTWLYQARLNNSVVLLRVHFIKLSKNTFEDLH